MDNHQLLLKQANKTAAHMQFFLEQDNKQLHKYRVSRFKNLHEGIFEIAKATKYTSFDKYSDNMSMCMKKLYHMFTTLHNLCVG